MTMWGLISFDVEHLLILMAYYHRCVCTSNADPHVASEDKGYICIALRTIWDVTIKVASDFNHCPWKNPLNPTDGVASLKNSFQRAEWLMHAFILFIYFSLEGTLSFQWSPGWCLETKYLGPVFFLSDGGGTSRAGKQRFNLARMSLHCHEEDLWGGNHPAGEAMRDPSTV